MISDRVRGELVDVLLECCTLELNVRSYIFLFNSAQKVDNVIPVRSQLTVGNPE